MPDSGEPLNRAQDEIDDETGQDGAEPPRMVHVKEAEKIEDFIKRDPVPLDILFAIHILGDQGTDDRYHCQQDEQKDRQPDGTEKIEEEGQDIFLSGLGTSGGTHGPDALSAKA
jgi:hypothetical protein